MYPVFEIGFILHRLSPDSLVLDLFPDVLVRVALGSVAGKKKYPQLPPMSADKVLNLLRLMKRGAIDQQDQRTRAPNRDRDFDRNESQR